MRRRKNNIKKNRRNKRNLIYVNSEISKEKIIRPEERYPTYVSAKQLQMPEGLNLYPPAGQVPGGLNPYPPAGQVPGGLNPYPPAGQVPGDLNPYPPAGQISGSLNPYPPYPPAGSVNYDKVYKQKVKIKSVAQGDYVVVGDDEYLYTQYYGYDVFVMIFMTGNKVKIKVQGGNFIRLDSNDFLIADADKNEADIFELYRVGNMEYAILAPNGYYVKVREKDNTLVAREKDTTQRAIFKFKEAR